VTANLDFKVTILFNVEQLENSARQNNDRTIGKSYYDISIGAIFNDFERPLTQISRSRSRYRCPLCAQLTRDLFAIAKFLISFKYTPTVFNTPVWVTPSEFFKDV